MSGAAEMRFTADHAFHIGSQHLRGGMPCQDYALSSTGTLGAFAEAAAIVSDGCSSGGKTDMGSRIIAHATAVALSLSPSHDARLIDFNTRFLELRSRETLQLQQADMLATAAYVAIRGQRAMTRIIGDGVMAGVFRNGKVIVNRVEWRNNMPVYLAYADDDFHGFISAQGGLHAQSCSQHIMVLDGMLVTEDSIFDHAVEYGLHGITVDHDLANFQFLSVFSDGVTQVDGMHWVDVVRSLMAFKSTEGRFVTRRMNRFLKDCLAHGKGPIDDISMACIHIQHDEVT